jgi:hypothetical protein
MSNNPFAKLGSSDRFSIVARERTRYRFWVRDCRLEAPDYRFRTPISERGEPRRSRERRQKQVVGAASLVKALLDSEIVATPTAIETIAEDDRQFRIRTAAQRYPRRVGIRLEGVSCGHLPRRRYLYSGWYWLCFLQ